MKKNRFIKYLPNLLTGINMLLGIFAIFFLLCSEYKNKIQVGCVLIIAGAIIDAFDGKIARSLGLCSEMGKQLDSFADQITFGLAPVCLIASLENFHNNLFAFAVLAVFPIAAAFRLARYNLGDYCEYFAGLPTTGILR